MQVDLPQLNAYELILDPRLHLPFINPSLPRSQIIIEQTFV